MTAVQESGDCNIESDPAGVTITITARPPEVTSGAPYAVEAQGLSGRCYAESPGACKIQAHCELVVTDALDPSNDIGTLQYVWTFDTAGFSGTNSVSIPPAKSLPDGCRGTAKATGKRL
jgi:hypothetical protein